jgi:hypothetical protein
VLNRRFFSETFAKWIVTGILGLAGGAVLTFLKLHQSLWAAPLLYGTAGAFMIWICGGVLIAVSRIPRMRTKVTVGNIEQTVRDWLDTAGCSVKRDDIQETFFRFTVVMAGGSTLLIGRPRRGLTDHVLVRGDILNENSIPKEFQNAALDDQERLIELIKLELARARVGYFGLALPITQQFAISKNIRITDFLREEDFLRAVFDVEAAVHAVLSIYDMWLKTVTRPALPGRASVPVSAELTTHEN